MPSRRSRAPTRRTPSAPRTCTGSPGRRASPHATNRCSPPRSASTTRACRRARRWPRRARHSGSGSGCWRAGRPARASGWLSRAQRLVDSHGEDCVEQGYLLLPAGQRHLSAGEAARAIECAARAALIGERFAEVDLIAFARNLKGRALLAAGQIAPGLSSLDEAMVAATAGELSPVVTGIVYCSAIASCHRVFALERVREWTAALSRWCEAHPQLGLFTGHCLVHRAEVMQMSGAWPEAVAEARSARSAAACATSSAMPPAVPITRQRGNPPPARGVRTWRRVPTARPAAPASSRSPDWRCCAWRRATREAAASASRRVVGATDEPLARTRFCPRTSRSCSRRRPGRGARERARELETIAATLDTEVLGAIAAHAAGCAAPGRGAAPGGASLRRGARSPSGSSSARPYLAARAAGAPGTRLRSRSATRTGRAWSWSARARCSRDSGRSPTAPPSRSSRAGWQPPRARRRPSAATDSRRASCRCCGSSPPAGPTSDRPRAVPEREDHRPPREQHLRQGRTSPRARPPPPSPTSTSWSEAPAGANYPCRGAGAVGDSPEVAAPPVRVGFPCRTHGGPGARRHGPSSDAARN